MVAVSFFPPCWIAPSAHTTFLRRLCTSTRWHATGGPSPKLQIVQTFGKKDRPRDATFLAVLVRPAHLPRRTQLSHEQHPLFHCHCMVCMVQHKQQLP
jgi:hypothetical protein